MKEFNINTILIPVDFSDTSFKALDHAILMAKLNKASITLLHVVEGLLPVSDPDEMFTSDESAVIYEKQVMSKGKAYMDKLAAKIKAEHAVEASALTAFGKTHKAILETAKHLKADIIIMGTHGVSGFREFVIGSNTFRIVSEANCPVLSVQKHTQKPGFKHILLPFRDKAHSRENVNYAIKMAEIYGAIIHVLGIDTDDDKASFRKISLEADQIKRLVEEKGVKCQLKVISGDFVSDLLLKYAGEIKADIIIAMSDMDRMRVSEYVVGPVIQQIVNHSPIPILSIRPMFNPNTIDLHGYGW